MFWPSTQPSCLIDIQNGLVETDLARSCGLGTGPRPRIPTRAIFSDFCASTGGAARAPRARATASAARMTIMPPPPCAGSARRDFLPAVDPAQLDHNDGRERDPRCVPL